MGALIQLIKWEVVSFLAALAALVSIQFLTGQINTAGLLFGQIHGRREQQQYFSPERVQLMVFTLGAASYYLSQVLKNPTPGTFPPIPETWPVIMGGSNLIYLAGKAYARWFARRSSK
jgi:hypothetical protein